MFSFVLHHWKVFGLGGGSLAAVAVVAGLLLNPAATLGLLRAVGGFVLDKAKALVERLRRFNEVDWWRLIGMSLAAACAYLAILTGTVRDERDAAVKELASVKTTIKTQVQEATTKAKAECNAANSRALAKSEAHARAVEAQLAQAISAADTAYQKGKEDAKRNGAVVAAGLRAGTVQLRDEWAGVRASPFDLPGAPGHPAGPDEAAELRAEGAGNLVEIGDDCDADIVYYQSVLAAERRPVK